MPYTSGTWTVKEGKEDEFVQAWGELAAWTTDTVDGALWAVLLRDEAQPNRFVSMGPWETREAIDSWREMPEFKEAVGALKELTDNIEVHVLEAVFEAGGR